jgi:hypothetical protein
MSSRRHLAPSARRTAWTVADQAVSSGTTLLVVAFMARRTSATGFGALSLLLSLSVIGVGFARAFGTDPLLVHHSTVGEGRLQAARRAVGVSTTMGLALGAVMMCVALASQGPLHGALLVGALVMPALTLQDGWRFVFFAFGRPAAALANDAVWTTVLVICLAVPATRQITAVAGLALVWAVGGVVAAFVGMLQCGTVPAGRPWRWIREHRQLSVRFMAEFVLLSGMNQLIAFAVASWQGLDQAGAMRAAALLLGPASVLANGLLAATVPEGARLRSDPRLLGRALPVVALVSAAVMVGWGVAVSYAPASVGRLLLGDRWPAAQQLVLIVAVFYAGANVVMVCAAGLRSLQDARRSLRLIAVLTVAMLVGGLVGASISTFAANVGLAVPAWVGAILAARVLRRSADAFEAETPTEVDETAASRSSQLAGAGR